MRATSTIRAGLVALLLGLGAGCDDSGAPIRDVPPGSCAAGQRVCHWDPVKQIETVLRCNAGQVPDAIWLIDLVCEPGDLCVDAACTPAS